MKQNVFKLLKYISLKLYTKRLYVYGFIYVKKKCYYRRVWLQLFLKLYSYDISNLYSSDDSISRETKSFFLAFLSGKIEMLKYSMVHIKDSNSELGAHVRSDFGYLIC